MEKTVVISAYPDERGVQSFQESRFNSASESSEGKARTFKFEQFVLYIDTPCKKRLATLRAVFKALPRQISIIGTLDMAAADAQVLILHTPPVESVALALQAGQGVTTATSNWRSCAEALLTFSRKNRQRCLIVEDTAFLSDPRKLIERLGLDLPDDFTKKLPSRPDAIFRILATEALRHDMLAGELAGELEASATIRASEQSQADIEIAYERYMNECAELASLRAAQAEFTLEKGDQDIVLRELFALQGKLEASKQNVKQLNQQLQILSHAQARTLNENEIKVRMLNDQISCLCRELENTKIDSESRNDEIVRIRSSKSFRVTQPIRWLHSALRRRR